MFSLIANRENPPNKKGALIIDIEITNRDITILQTITKFRFLLSRQIKVLCLFSGQRACDRRLKKLIDAGYVQRKRFIYGVPSLYFATSKAKQAFNLNFITKSVRIEQIVHDILVVDTAIFIMQKLNLNIYDFITERELKHTHGFGASKHTPDLIFIYNDKKHCAEIEISEKQKQTLEKNAKDNYLNFDIQIWFVDMTKPKINRNLVELLKTYENIKIKDIRRVKNDKETTNQQSD